MQQKGSNTEKHKKLAILPQKIKRHTGHKQTKRNMNLPKGGSEGKAQDGNISSKGGSSAKGDSGKSEKGPVLNKI